MAYKNSIIEQIGNTPLIKLNRINKGLRTQLFAKLESANPGGKIIEEKSGDTGTYTF